MSEPPAERAGTGPEPLLDKRITVAVIALAVAIAAYTGFRLPNAWTATLDSVSLFDGFYRRFVVGTLLRPLAVLTDHDYRLFAAFSYLVLGALIAIIAVAAVRTRHLGQRLLVIAWFLLPTGGFAFNEVGYFEQLLYLLLFTSMWLVHRNRVVAATCLMSVAPFIHEIAIVTVVPIYGLVALRNLAFRRALIATLIPAALNCLVLVIPAASEGAVDRLATTLYGANFPFRVDALVLFQRTQSEAWTLYSVHDVVVYVKPAMMVLVGAFVALWMSDRRGWLRDRDVVAAPLVLLASCAAIAIPYLLVYGGWDGNRWLFLVISNFFIVVWISLGYRPRLGLRPGSIAVILATVLVVSRANIWYFDGRSPRDLGYRPVRDFVIKELATGSLFEIPDE